MNQSLRLTIVLAVTAILAVVIVRQRWQIAELQAEVASLSAKASAPKPLPVQKKTPPPPMTVSTPVEETELPAVPVVSSTVTQAVPAAAAEPAMPNMFTKIREMAKDPAFKDMIRAQQKMAMDMIYGSLFKKLNLTGDDLTDFKNLLADRQMALMDAGMSMMSGNTSNADREQRLKDVAQIKAANDQKIEEFLGADGFAIFKNYEETQTERTQVNLFKQSLAGADALTEQQEQDLIAAMYQERKNMPASIPTLNSIPDPKQFTPDKIEDLSKVMDQLQARYLERATTILTPAQLGQFKTAQEQMRAMQTMGLKMATQMFGKDAAPAASPPANAPRP